MRKMDGDVVVWRDGKLGELRMMRAVWRGSLGR